jgi:hypothetical protein
MKSYGCIRIRRDRTTGNYTNGLRIIAARGPLFTAWGTESSLNAPHPFTGATAIMTST